ncbi:MAG: serine hydrolase [Provencibacterium sp.]|jgi:CubicO group peptidase (beta-lactamase class C family)|nr:serine hydrolase [Provencibacterium sp.]
MKRCFALFLAGVFLLSACSKSGGPSAVSDTLSPASSSVSSRTASRSEPAAEIKSVSEPASRSDPVSEPEADHSWQFDTPENHGMDPAVFDALHAALPGTGIHAAVTVKDGAVIDEYYEEGYDEDSIFAMHSASKSVTSALIGIAVEEGYIGGVDDLVSAYLPQILEQEDTRKHTLTLRHLLTHTSGLEWYEWGSGYSNWAEFRSAENWVDYILGRTLIYEPGSHFAYSTGNTHLLSAVLQAATGKTQEEYCRIRLFDPMGVSEEAHWRADAQGVADGGNGMFISARDAAKLGQLFLDGGVWRGRRLVPAAWVEESTSEQNAGPGGSTGRYGYQWWIQTHTAGENGSYATPYPSGTYEVYFAFGHAGQFIYVVPELNMVTVFASSCQSSYGPRPYFTDYILNAYMGG